MAFRSKIVAVTTTPVAAVDGSNSIDGARASITNVDDATSVFVGGDDMTSANAATHGLEIIAGAGLDDIELADGEIMWAVTLAGSSSLAVAASGIR